MRLRLAAFALIALVPSFARAAGPVCALLDPEKDPRAALLEAKLLADPASTWVERANVDAVLKEQKLQTLFSPQGVGDRVRLGKLLKADILVLVRPVKDAKEPALEIVVSETAGGLRLLLRGVPITKDAGADVAALLFAVRDGIKKHGEKIREVVAVPPFVSNDLEFTFDHMKGAYAKLAEAEALNRPGIVVVELAEAEAIAKELALAAPGTKLDRPLPVYLLGEYRHEGKGIDRTVAVKLRAERGGKQVVKPTATTSKADESPAVVRKWAAETLDAVMVDGKPRPPADPKAEAKQLAERGRTFQRLANWPEASALYEAALLLEPGSADLLAAAMLPLTRMAQKLEPGGPTPTTIQKLRAIQALGMSHLETLIALDATLKPYVERKGLFLIVEFSYAMRQFSPFSTQAGWPRKELEELHEMQRQATLRLIPLMARGASQAEYPYVSDALSFLSPKDRYALAEQLIVELQDLPEHKFRAMWILRAAWMWRAHAFQIAKPGEEEAAFRELLGRLVASKNAGVKAAAQDTLKALELELKNAGTPPRPPEPEGVRFSVLHLVLESSGGPVDPVHGILAISPTVDVVWAGTGLYLMKQKGKLRPVWTTDEQSFRFQSVVYDGRYIWAATRHFKKWPTLMVIDPVTEKIWHVGAAEGLPQGPEEQLKQVRSRFVDVAPLGPGRVCAAGSIGRAWVGLVTFDATAGKATVKVIHEAREAPDMLDVTQAGKTTIDFVPGYMLTIAGPPSADGKSGQRVVIGRAYAERLERGGNGDVANTPLVVDPERKTVEVLKGEYIHRMPTFPHHLFATAKGTVYTVELLDDNTPNARVKLLRLGMPGPAVTPVAKAGPPPILFSHLEAALLQGDRLLFLWAWHDRPPPSAVQALGGTSVFVNNDLWSIGLDGTTPRKLASKLPYIVSLHQSAHYGLVAYFFNVEAGKPELHRVEFTVDGPAKAVAKKHPDEEKGTKSEASVVESALTFVNKSGQPIRLYWLDYDGKRKLYKEIAPGERFEQKTYVKHVWLITDADDNAWRVIRPGAKPETIEIVAPIKK